MSTKTNSNKQLFRSHTCYNIKRFLYPFLILLFLFHNFREELPYHFFKHLSKRFNVNAEQTNIFIKS